jgi:hypothetical protein
MQALLLSRLDANNLDLCPLPDAMLDSQVRIRLTFAHIALQVPLLRWVDAKASEGTACRALGQQGGVHDDGAVHNLVDRRGLASVARNF